jgi:hypothetical protein
MCKLQKQEQRPQQDATLLYVVKGTTPSPVDNRLCLVLKKHQR